jgi:hypothetical protein
MKDSSKLLSTIAKQYLNEQASSKKETVEEFIKRFKVENPNKNFLNNHLKVPNFKIYLTHDGDIKFKESNCSLPNKCEKNTFNFIKDMVTLDNHRYYPVSGWAFMESTAYFEHFWAYDDMKDIFIDVSPMGNDRPYAYGGVINFNINDDILNAKDYTEIPFLLGKASHSLYHKYKNNKTLPISKKKDKHIFDFINKNKKYKELSEFIDDYNIVDIEHLKSYLSKLKDKLDVVRTNREYDLYSKLIQQIENLDIFD